MVTAEDLARAEGYAAGQQDQVIRTRDEIDAAYDRGFQDGAGGRKFITMLFGIIVGAVSTGVWFIV